MHCYELCDRPCKNKLTWEVKELKGKPTWRTVNNATEIQARADTLKLRICLLETKPCIRKVNLLLKLTAWSTAHLE